MKKQQELGTEENPIKISHMLAAASCPWGYYLDHKDTSFDKNSLPMVGYSIRKPFLMNRIWGNKQNKNSGLFRKDDHSIRFETPQSFAGSASGWFKTACWPKDATFFGKPLAWRYFGEKKTAASHINTAAQRYYNNLIDENYQERVEQRRESPIIARKYDSAFFYQGLKFVVTTDEIWDDMTIRKLKVSSSRGIFYNPSLVMQFLTYTTSVIDYGLGEKFRLSEEQESALRQDIFEGGPKVQIHDLVNSLLHDVPINQESIDDFMTLVEEAIVLDEGEDFPENTARCEYCKFNVETLNGFIPCTKRSTKREPMIILSKK